MEHDHFAVGGKLQVGLDRVVRGHGGGGGA